MTGAGRAGALAGRMARTMVLGAALAVAAPSRPSALDKIPDLNGVWIGEGLEIVIDTKRLQGNVDPAKPFERQPFFIRNVTGQMVVFVIGPHVFVARMDGPDKMTVSRDGLFATYALTRARSAKDR
jgi:hypothetical protein